MNIRDYLKQNILITDGAMGTYYSSLHNENVISETANIEAPGYILQIHESYIEAGANLIRTNSFAANRQTIKMDAMMQEQVLNAAYDIAEKAVKEAKQHIFIACSIGPIPEHGERTEEDILDEYKLICDTFIKKKAEIILFETFSDMKFIRKLVPYIKEKAPELFIMTNFSINKNGYSSSGISAAALLEEITITDGIEAGGFNCGIGSGHMFHILKTLHFPENKYISVLPNAGYPEQFKNRMIFMDNEGYFVDNMKRIADLGVDIIGGCCGTTPKYIKKLVEQINIHEKQQRNRNHYSLEKSSISQNERNDFYQLFETGKKIVAVELDPPFDAETGSIINRAHYLKNSGVDMITIADSPMGRSRVDSILMSIKIFSETGLMVMPHVCCRDKNMIAMRSGLLGAYVNGIRNVLIVTGDPIPSENRQSTTGVFDYNSIRLMNFVKSMNEEHFSEEPIYYGGALNYSRGNIDKVIERMENKIAAGAKYFLTQPVYSDEDIDRIRYIKSKVDTKILVGIMPLVSYRNASFIKNEIAGIHVPDEIIARYKPEMSKEEGEWVGARVANEIIEKLSSCADGYYFMLPFNRVSLMDKIQIK